MHPPELEPRLLPVPIADRLDPAGPPPGAAWDSRHTDRISDFQYRITIPCWLATPVGTGIHAQLTGELRRRWVEAPARPWNIAGVVAAFNEQAELTLVITVARALRHPLSQSLDASRMREELALALGRAIQVRT